MEKKKSLHRLRSPPLLSRKSQTLTSSTISHRCLRRRRLLWRRPSSTSCSTRMTAAYPPAPRTASGSTTATPSVRSSAATSTARRRDRRRGDALPLQHPGARWRRSEPQYPPNKLMIWDDHQSRCIGELSFQLEVQAVHLRRDRIVVVLEQRVFVYNFADLKLMQQIETVPSRKGLCAVSQAAATFVLVCPGTQKGQVRVENYSSMRTKFIAAHDSRVACFALTPDGRLLATASSKGTLVRIFNTCDGALLQEENSITTTKYNILTFLPKGLFEQFRRVANLYFCMISILSTTPISPVHPITNVVPLSIVLFASLVKEAFEEWAY